MTSNPTDHSRLRPLAPDSLTVCYSPRLRARVLVPTALTMLWSAEDWPEIRQHLKWLLAEERRMQRQGWLGSSGTTETPRRARPNLDPPTDLR